MTFWRPSSWIRFRAIHPSSRRSGVWLAPDRVNDLPPANEHPDRVCDIHAAPMHPAVRPHLPRHLGTASMIRKVVAPVLDVAVRAAEGESDQNKCRAVEPSHKKEDNAETAEMASEARHASV